MDNVTADFLASNQSTIRLAITVLLGATDPVLNQNPLDLTSVLVFGALLTGILLLGEFLKN